MASNRTPRPTRQGTRAKPERHLRGVWARHWRRNHSVDCALATLHVSDGSRSGLPWRALLVIALLALMLRAGLRFATGAADFWTNGYTFYFELARNLSSGRGFSFDGESPTAFRVPLYPIFLAAVTLGRANFVALVLAQSLVGAGTVLCAGAIANRLFGAAVGVVAALATALYPYYVVHDTAMQENAMVTLLTAVSVLLLLTLQQSSSAPTQIAAVPETSRPGRSRYVRYVHWRVGVATVSGLVLAAAVLTRATIVPFAVIAPMWLVVTATSERRESLRLAAICTVVLGLGLMPWLVRSHTLTGSAGLSTEAGLQLWCGNNPWTFDHYPRESIDTSCAAALDNLTGTEREEITKAGEQIDSRFQRKALEYMRDHPWLAIRSAVHKNAAAFGWLPSPRRSFWPTLVYAATYGPISLIAVIGIAMSRRAWREHSLIWLLILTFTAVTAVFFGHTSHRAFLDVYLIIYAAFALCKLLNPWIFAKPARRDQRQKCDQSPLKLST